MCVVSEIKICGSLSVFNPTDSCQRSPLQKKVDGVLSEAMHLIEHLEADRKYAEEALQKEREKRKTLESKVDSISLWRQTELPALVQKGS